MKILFLLHPYPNYLTDMLLQGLRKQFGSDVVEFPRKDPVYDGIFGQPTLEPIPGFMEHDADVDRDDLIAKVSRGYFDFVLTDVRVFRDLIHVLQNNTCPLALIDGEDQPWEVRPGPYVVLRRETDGNDNSIPCQMAIPSELISWIERYQSSPKTHSVGFLGSRSAVTPERNRYLDALATMVPDGLVDSWDASVPSPGRDGYYQNLQRCKILLSLPGAGRTTFRYWENAACTGIHLSTELPVLVPHDFREGREILRFTSPRQLAWLVESVLTDRVDSRAIAESSRAWLRQYHTSEKRALQIIDRLKAAFLV